MEATSTDKHPSSPQRKIAMGILIVSVLALIVGLVNAASLQMSNKPLAETDSDSSVSSMLGKKDHLALIDLSGPIFMDAPQEQGGQIFESDTNAVSARKALDKAAEDNSVKGVLLRINSPGGTVAMSQELNAAVQRVSKKKPIVASLGDMTASGGYYTACGADKIITNPGTLSGSIGVIISTMNFRGLMQDKLGVKAVTIKSGKFKDILSPYRDPTPEDLALMQKLINDSYQDFLNTVIQGRTKYVTDPNKKAAMIEHLKAVADGRVVHGREAVVVGLADEIGDMKYAYEVLDGMAKERAGLSGKKKLPLEKSAAAPTILEFLGLSGGDDSEVRSGLAGLMSRMSQHESAKDFMPFSMRYPNQLLWIYE